jgi:1-acyl-sn-glycerol-3-phosphate acyltransferase
MPEGWRRERTLALIRELAGDGGRFLDTDARLSDLGFDSLSFAELATAVERDLGADLSSASLGQDDRIADVLRVVDGVRARSAPAAVPRGTGRLQGFADLIGGWLVRWWFALQVVGSERLPSSGPVVLAMNHESALDIPIIVVACPRRITFMAKKELFKNAFVTWALRGLGAFRVDRDRFDLRAVDLAIAAVSRGDVLGMYPEGTRSPGALRPFLPGAAWVALRTGSPLVPCTIAGTERARRATLPHRVRVRVEFHHPIAVERVEDPGERRREAAGLTERLRAAIEAGLAR